MNTLAYKINQWNFWGRASFLLGMLLVLFSVWYFFLERPLIKNHQAILEKQSHTQMVAKELSTLLSLKTHFIYKHALQAIQMKPMFQKSVTGIPGLTMTNYVDNPAMSLPAGAVQFPQVMAMFNLPLRVSVQKSSATITFSAGFSQFLTYLKNLNTNRQRIYFDSIDFNMNRYPKAEITLKVFTLEGA